MFLGYYGHHQIGKRYTGATPLGGLDLGVGACSIICIEPLSEDGGAGVRWTVGTAGTGGTDQVAPSIEAIRNHR